MYPLLFLLTFLPASFGVIWGIVFYSYLGIGKAGAAIKVFHLLLPRIQEQKIGCFRPGCKSLLSLFIMRLDRSL